MKITDSSSLQANSAWSHLLLQSARTPLTATLGGGCDRCVFFVGPTCVINDAQTKKQVIHDAEVEKHYF
jgi:hypothetical protein